MAEKLYQDRNWLYEQYWVKGKALAAIAKMVGRTHGTILYWMKKLDIPRRTTADALILRHKPALYQDRHWLHKMHWKEGKSLHEMSRIAQCGYATIHHWMTRFGIPKRAHAEATAKANRRKAQDPKWLEKVTKINRRHAKDPMWLKKNARIMHQVHQRLALKKQRRGEMTDIEAICHAAFESLGLEFTFEAYIKGYIVDFLITSHNIIVEAYGKYWHELPKQREKDIDRKQFLEACGYIVLEWWGPDIKTDVWHLIEEELLPLLDQPSRMEYPPQGVSKPYRGPHGWRSAIQLYLFGKEQED